MNRRIDKLEAVVREIDEEVEWCEIAVKVLAVLAILFFLGVPWFGWAWFLTVATLGMCVGLRSYYLHDKALMIEDEIRTIDRSYE